MRPRKNVQKQPTKPQEAENNTKSTLRFIPICNGNSVVTISDSAEIKNQKKIMFTKNKMYEVYRSKSLLANKGIKKLYKTIRDSIKEYIQSEEIDDVDLETWFSYCIFCYLFGGPNELLGKKYQPLYESQLFDAKGVEALRKGLLGFFRYEKPVYKSNNSKFNNTICNSKGGLYDYLLSTQETEFDGGKLGIIIEGPEATGKSTTINAFSSSYGFEVENIDFAMYKSLREIVNKYQLAVVMNDVKMNISNHQKLPPSSKENPPDNIMKFFNMSQSVTIPKNINQKVQKRDIGTETKAKSKFDHRAKKVKSKQTQKNNNRKISSSDDDSLFDIGDHTSNQIYTAFGGNEFDEYQNRKKLFVCRNVEYLYKKYYLVNKKDFQRHFDKFLQFINLSGYPFVFISNEKHTALFNSSSEYFETIKTRDFKSDEVFSWMYIVATLEENLGELRNQLTRFRNFDYMDKGKDFESLCDDNVNELETHLNKSLKSFVMPRSEVLYKLIEESGCNMAKIYSYLEINLPNLFESEDKDIDLGFQYDPLGYDYRTLYPSTELSCAKHSSDSLDLYEKELGLLESLDILHKRVPDCEWRYPTDESKFLFRRASTLQLAAK